MNNKKTNYFISILDFLVVVAIFLLTFSSDFFASKTMSGINGGKSVFNSLIIDFLFNNIEIILITVCSAVGILNIIASFQNKKNPKLRFWQLAFGWCEVWNAVNLLFGVVGWINKVLFGILPVILVLINIGLVAKNKVKINIIRIISYGIVIAISVLEVFEITSGYWSIITVVMQIIYIGKQEKNVEESKARKTINIILYYILQCILSVGFLGIVITAFVIAKVNTDKWDAKISDIFNEVVELQDISNETIYIPVENEFKYGFINENGEEKIKCQYDKVSFFHRVEINDKVCYIALAKKDDDFYIISKDNDYIRTDDELNKYLEMVEEYWGNERTKFLKAANEDTGYRDGNVTGFDLVLNVVFGQGKVHFTSQSLDLGYKYNKIDLEKVDSKYNYEGENYSLTIEQILDDENYNDERYIYDYTYCIENTKYNVTIAKRTGEQETSVVFLPRCYLDDGYINTFSNGTIEFRSEDNQNIGYYDENGNKVTFPIEYRVNDVKDDKVFLEKINTEQDYTLYEIRNKSNEVLAETTAFEEYENVYLLKNKNGKMVLTDSEFKEISQEYDRILGDTQKDTNSYFSSYN